MFLTTDTLPSYTLSTGDIAHISSPSFDRRMTFDVSASGLRPQSMMTSAVNPFALLPPRYDSLERVPRDTTSATSAANGFDKSQLPPSYLDALGLQLRTPPPAYESPTTSGLIQHGDEVTSGDSGVQQLEMGDVQTARCEQSLYSNEGRTAARNVTGGREAERGDGDDDEVGNAGGGSDSGGRAGGSGRGGCGGSDDGDGGAVVQILSSAAADDDGDCSNMMSESMT